MGIKEVGLLPRGGYRNTPFPVGVWVCVLRGLQLGGGGARESPRTVEDERAKSDVLL